MIGLLAKPWLGLPRLLAIYGTIAVGAPCAFFITYELTALFRSSGSLVEYPYAKAILLTLIIIGLLVVPFIRGKLTHRRDKQESIYSDELAEALTSTLIASLGISQYLREQSAYSEIHEETIKTMHSMIANAGRINLSDEHLERMQQTKRFLERSGNESDFEFLALLTRFLDKYQETHQRSL